MPARAPSACRPRWHRGSRRPRARRPPARTALPRPETSSRPDGPACQMSASPARLRLRELRSLVCRDIPSGRPDPTRRSATTPGRRPGSAGSRRFPAAPRWSRSSRSARTSWSSSGSNRPARRGAGRGLRAGTGGDPRRGRIRIREPAGGLAWRRLAGAARRAAPLSLNPVPTWSEFYAHQRLEAVLAQGQRLGIYDDQASHSSRRSPPGSHPASWTPGAAVAAARRPLGRQRRLDRQRRRTHRRRPLTAATARPTSRSSSCSAPRTSTRSSAGMRRWRPWPPAGGSGSRCTSCTRYAPRRAVPRRVRRTEPRHRPPLGLGDAVAQRDRQDHGDTRLAGWSRAGRRRDAGTGGCRDEGQGGAVGR